MQFISKHHYLWSYSICCDANVCLKHYHLLTFHDELLFPILQSCNLYFASHLGKGFLIPAVLALETKFWDVQSFPLQPFFFSRSFSASSNLTPISLSPSTVVTTENVSRCHTKVPQLTLCNYRTTQKRQRLDDTISNLQVQTVHVSGIPTLIFSPLWGKPWSQYLK